MPNAYARLKERLIAFSPAFIIIVCLCQPVLDALSYWQVELSLGNALSFMPRIVLMLALALLGFIISERKRSWCITAAVLVAFGAAHVISCRSAGYVNPASDILNYIRVLMLPVATLCLISCLRANEKCREALKKGVLYTLGLILLLTAIAVLTKTDPFTYPDKQLGFRGWNIWPNSQSAVLSLLAPLSIAYVLEKRRRSLLLCGLVSVLALLALWLYGTRLAFASMLVTGFGLGLTVFFIKGMPKRLGVLLLAVTLLLTAGYSYSPMVKNQRIVAVNAAAKVAVLNRLLAEGETAAEGLTGTAYQTKRLEKCYRYALTDLVDCYGLERVLEQYNYTDSVPVLTSEREFKLQFSNLLMEQSPTSKKLFGVENDQVIYGSYPYDAENDFPGIYFQFGAVGLALTVGFLLYFLWLLLWAALRHFRQVFTLGNVAVLLALGTCLVHAWCTCAVLRRPNTLIYLAILLAAVYDAAKLQLILPGRDEREALP